MSGASPSSVAPPDAAAATAASALFTLEDGDPEVLCHFLEVYISSLSGRAPHGAVKGHLVNLVELFKAEPVRVPTRGKVAAHAIKNIVKFGPATAKCVDAIYDACNNPATAEQTIREHARSRETAPGGKQKHEREMVRKLGIPDDKRRRPNSGPGVSGGRAFAHTYTEPRVAKETRTNGKKWEKYRMPLWKKITEFISGPV